MMKPEEICDLQPTTDCNIVTSLVPHLRQREICEYVPKEFCHTKLDSPKMVRKPITMKWCTFPTGDGYVSGYNPETRQASKQAEVTQPSEDANTGGVEDVLQGVNLRIQPGFNLQTGPPPKGPNTFDNALVNGRPTL